jgi:hypothetical protein
MIGFDQPIDRVRFGRDPSLHEHSVFLEAPAALLAITKLAGHFSGGALNRRHMVIEQLGRADASRLDRQPAASLILVFAGRQIGWSVAIQAAPVLRVPKLLQFLAHAAALSKKPMLLPTRRDTNETDWQFDYRASCPTRNHSVALKRSVLA